MSVCLWELNSLQVVIDVFIVCQLLLETYSTASAIVVSWELQSTSTLPLVHLLLAIEQLGLKDLRSGDVVVSGCVGSGVALGLSGAMLGLWRSYHSMWGVPALFNLNIRMRRHLLLLTLFDVLRHNVIDRLLLLICCLMDRLLLLLLLLQRRGLSVVYSSSWLLWT